MLSVLGDENMYFNNFSVVRSGSAVFLGGFGRAMAAGVAGDAIEGAG